MLHLSSIEVKDKAPAKLVFRVNEVARKFALYALNQIFVAFWSLKVIHLKIKKSFIEKFLVYFLVELDLEDGFATFVQDTSEVGHGAVDNSVKVVGRPVAIFNNASRNYPFLSSLVNDINEVARSTGDLQVGCAGEKLVDLQLANIPKRLELPKASH